VVRGGNFRLKYVELHARSAFTFLEGASLPEALVVACSQNELPAMALLDRNGFYGSPRFHLAAQQMGIKAHIGAELSLADTPRVDAPNYPLLCASQIGYKNLCQLITKTKFRVPKNTPSAATLEELKAHSEGLICLTGDERGPLAQALQQGGAEEGRRCLEELVSVFGKSNVYVELQRHFHREQEARNQAAIALARELKLPLLATNGVSYATIGEREIADVFTCIKHGVKLHTAGRLLARNSQRHVLNPEEMARLFADIPEAIANTIELSSRLEFTLENLGYEFPKYPVRDGETMSSFLRERVWQGAQNRYRPLTERIKRQIKRELKLIEKLKLEGYFLIVWDIINNCKQNGILVQGRGSAANSAVCYALEITAVDPIGMDLLFERFLSEERGEWPDIDLDLPSGDEREKAIQYVYTRYGQLGAAMTANVCCYRGRSAAREVGKVLGFEEDTLSRLSKIVGTWEWKGPDDVFDKQFKKAGLDTTQRQIALYLNLCQRLQDLPRHLSQHSGGMVICQGQLDAVVPLEPATMPNRVVVQWDKDDCASLGLIKVDLLGLGMMAVVKDSIQLIRDHYGEEVDLAHLPQDAPDVYETIQRADTVAMFQIESRAQMASLPRNNPQKFYDLVTQVALIRPGPIVGQMTNPYLKRRQGKQAVIYPHPELEPVLKRTLGVPLFQEQLLKMAMICANFTGGEAEELRRALGSKRSKEKMQAIETKLRAGMEQKGITGKKQDEIVQFITSFALYGFPESHAASFALLAYASAFLKVRYLAAFTCAMLNNMPLGFYSSDVVLRDARRHGLRTKAPDVTCSDWNCTIEHDEGELSLRVGLRYIKGLNKKTAEALLHARKSAPFVSISDLAFRVPAVSARDLLRFARSGALNRIGGNGEQTLHRRDALWQAQKAAQFVGPLFEWLVDTDTRSPLEQMTTEERLIADYGCTGLTVDYHPLHYKRPALTRMRVKAANELLNIHNNANVSVAGCVIARQRPGTAQGFIFLSLEDETGISNIIIDPDLYTKYTLTVLHERFVLVKGVLQNQEGVVHVKARHIEPLRSAFFEHTQDHRPSQPNPSPHSAAALHISSIEPEIPSHDFH
jgi:error-prone DNA polymerase